jgi:hypothetical protein
VADWTTISALSTAGGTLVLAAATFASVRSANRSARAAERSMLPREDGGCLAAAARHWSVDGFDPRR